MWLIPSKEFTSQAEAHFAKIEAPADSMTGIAVSIPLYSSWTLATPRGITFSRDKTLNPTGFDRLGPDSSYQTAVKTQLRLGGANVLNAYIVAFVSGSGAGLLRYPTFSSSYSSNTEDSSVVILYSSVPSGTSAPYNDDTGSDCTTFEGGYSSPCDSADDTPTGVGPIYDRPASSGTCVGEGSDLFRNYVDNSGDSCMEKFTLGQFTRLESRTATYRGIV